MLEVACVAGGPEPTYAAKFSYCAKCEGYIDMFFVRLDAENNLCEDV